MPVVGPTESGKNVKMAEATPKFAGVQPKFNRILGIQFLGIIKFRMAAFGGIDPNAPQPVQPRPAGKSASRRPSTESNSARSVSRG